MSLKMKTCFKFLPLFLCFFFILSGSICGNKGAKQLQQLEKKGENHQDGNHDGGGSGGTTSTTPVTGNTDDGSNGNPLLPDTPDGSTSPELTIESGKPFKVESTSKLPFEVASNGGKVKLKITDKTTSASTELIVLLANADSQTGDYSNVDYRTVTTGWVLVGKFKDSKGQLHELWILVFYYDTSSLVYATLAVDLPANGNPGKILRDLTADHGVTEDAFALHNSWLDVSDTFTYVIEKPVPGVTKGKFKISKAIKN